MHFESWFFGGDNRAVEDPVHTELGVVSLTQQVMAVAARRSQNNKKRQTTKFRLRWALQEQLQQTQSSCSLRRFSYKKVWRSLCFYRFCCLDAAEAADGGAVRLNATPDAQQVPVSSFL